MPVQTNLAPPLSGVQAKLSLARVVGTPTRTAWAQVHSFSGQLFAAISLDLDPSVLGEPGAASVDVGHEIITRLNEEYFGSDPREKSPFKLMQKAVETVSVEFGENSKLEICVAALWQQYIYFCVFGPGRVFVKRDGSLSTILTGEEGKVAATSGVFRANDVFILATSAFVKLVDAKSLQDIFNQGLSIAEIADNIVPLAHRLSLPTLAGAMIKISSGQIAQQIGVSEYSTSQQPGTSDVLKYRSAGTPITRVPSSPTTRTSFLKNLLIMLALKLPEEVNTTSFRISSSGRKTAVSVGILLLLLFGLSIAFGLKQKQSQEYRLTYQEQLSQAEGAYNESLLQKDVDASRARELFVQAKKLSDELVQRGVKDGKLDALRAQIAASMGDILGEVLAEPSIFLDLSLVRSGITAREIALDGQDLAVLDSQGQRIVISEGRETASVGGPEKLHNPRAVGVYSGRYFTVGDDGVVELDRKGAVNNKIKPDGWGEITKLGVFGSNLYLLDKGKSSSNSGQVWRYAGVEGEFGEKQRWLGSAVAPNFSQVVDMAIDGSIWLLDSGGAIMRYTRGAPQSIRVQGLEKPISAPTALYTDEELGNIYILDRGNARIVELTKSGVYEKQYLAGQISEAIDFVVSKKSAKIYLLTPSKVLELPL